jgi:hypothetical protein
MDKIDAWKITIDTTDLLDSNDFLNDYYINSNDSNEFVFDDTYIVNTSDNEINLSFKELEVLVNISKANNIEDKIQEIYKNFNKLFGMDFEEYLEKLNELKNKSPEKFI